MILTNYRNFKNVNYANKVKSIYEENKKNESQPNYTTRADYEKVLKNIAVSNNDIEPEKALKNFNNIESKNT